MLLLQAVQVIGGAQRVRRCREYRPLVFLEHGQPVAEICGVVISDFGRDAEFYAEESGSEFRHQFLAGVAVIPEPLPAEIPIRPVLGFRPVGQLMQGCSVITLPVFECLEGRKLYRIA